MDRLHDWTRRTFMKAVGGVVPTLTIFGEETPDAFPAAGGWPQAVEATKFTPLDLSDHFTASPAEFGARERAKSLGEQSAKDGLIRMPAGKQVLRGIPFLLGPQGTEKRSWVVLSARQQSWVTRTVELPVNDKADFLCLAQFCDWDENETPPPGVDVEEKVGQHLADVALVYADGQETVLPIRRRFEVNSPSTVWGHLSYASLAHLADRPLHLADSLGKGTGWGDLQTVVEDNNYTTPVLWVCALANPQPARTIKAVRMLAAGEDPLVVCGVTLFRGRQNPLRLNRLTLYRITLPDPVGEDPERWKVSVDLGVVARTYTLDDFSAAAWLASPEAGLGARAKPHPAVRYLYAEVTAASDATLSLYDTKKQEEHRFELSQIVPGQELAPLAPGTGPARIEILEPERVWVHGQVVDASTAKPTPVRLAFRSAQGRYLPPYGHRAEINDAWFQDYGADVKLMDSSFAYVDGSFQIELPVGDVYVEITKGFEYEAVRRKIRIEPHQRELKLEISRIADLRAKGWVTADTHVHFLSPTTALLEAQAEGLNLVNLLAAQWGDLFTNVGDITGRPLASPDGETVVWVGTENRQHLLGHIGLLGTRRPVYPMSASGPSESYLGGPLWTTLAEWADQCREREGLAVAVHFPYPTAELAADIVLGKIDAVELWPSDDAGRPKIHFNTLRYLDWYRYLNCGYRLPAVGGTDKMGAYMPVGTNRAYAQIGQAEFSFGEWAKAVRKGNTFVSSGPLLFLQVEDHSPGEEITLPAGGGTLEVRAEARSFVPFHDLEIVLNGRVVASRRASSGTRELVLKESIKVGGPGWLAARCSSELGPMTNWEFHVQAHTSPVYLKVPGQELFSAPAAAYMLTLIEGARTWAENLATRPDAERFAQVLSVWDRARDELHRRMHAHGINH